ncbi:phosphoribosylglycinamide synthetase [Escherichia coli]|uniref:Phosphoribosylglycinamide synthetase n=3 Tax=Escherichia coli TaxID=562 RepID=A0A2I2GXE3_ECOLX|nr:phosphoribosylglycinamide synthetase [Escherichia coli]AWJ50015.1 phosphoribosylglycinamide synthetase [Escherichia coli O43 str. RM10042]EFO2112394.1 phosphoribosylglycinamide synthetase [Escherichia coli O106]EFO2285948.1 phosphoribosylglycinamide synthetase [Escherichia coli O148]EFO3065944.1 phosphoribosylglycinamide synthetase [Escherichia coli O73]PBO95744.1 phosphoribosylglycinamide synthetase [Shigella sonnei]QCH60841.1 phosphoribosylglycinamide synthetase [Escherichia coli O91:H21
MRQMATYYIHWRHALLIHDGDFISTQTVSSAHQILYNDARFPPLGTPKA